MAAFYLHSNRTDMAKPLKWLSIFHLNLCARPIHHRTITRNALYYKVLRTTLKQNESCAGQWQFRTERKRLHNNTSSFAVAYISLVSCNYSRSNRLERYSAQCRVIYCTSWSSLQLIRSALRAFFECAKRSCDNLLHSSKLFKFRKMGANANAEEGFFFHLITELKPRKTH